MSFTNYLEDKVMNHAFGGAAFTQPTSFMMALYTVTPADDGTGGTEVTGDTYARTAIVFGASSGGVVANSAEVAFPQAGGIWMAGAQITHFGIFDNLGNLVNIGTVSGTLTVAANETVKFAIGQLTMSLD